jgi:hypothetical protein
MAVGTVTDIIVAHSMRALRDDGELKVDLAAVGRRMLRRVIAESKAKCDAIRHGEIPRWARVLPPLVHDFHCLDVGAAYANTMVERVAEALDTWEVSETWAWLRDVGPSRWAPILRIDQSELPTVEIAGVKAYAPYDIAALEGDCVHVVDIKAGRATATARAEARFQLTVYGWWASHVHGRPIGEVLVAAQWLSEGERQYRPVHVRESDVEDLHERVRADIETEQRLIRALRNGQRAEQVFAPHPETRRCMSCSWLTMCRDGQEAVRHAVSIGALQ